MDYRESHCLYLKSFEILHEVHRNKGEWFYSFKRSKYLYEPRQTIGVFGEGAAEIFSQH